MFESHQVRGIIPPIITPLAERDRLDIEGLNRLIEHLIAGGVHGLFVLGTSGEGPSLSRALRSEMVQQTCRIVNSRLPVYVGITDTSIIEALDFAEQSRQAGAAAVVAAPPFYFPAGQTELTHFYTQLVQGLKLPLLLYNMPSCTKLSIEQQTLEELIQDEMVIGIKDSSGDLEYLKNVLGLARKKRDDWVVLVGSEALLAEAMALGALGGVTGGANLDPRLFVDWYHACLAGDREQIATDYERVIQLSSLYTIGKYDSAFLKGMKCALNLKGICSGLLAAPYDEFKPRERERVATWLKQYEKQQIENSNSL